MRFSDILLLSLRMFRARTLRTLLTILGMSIGIAAIFFLVSLGYGLQQTLLERITTSDALATLDVSEDPGKSTTLNQEALEQIRMLPGVLDVIPALRPRGQATFRNITLDLDTLGASSDFLRLEHPKPLSGSIEFPGSRTVIVTSGIAKTFGVTSEEMLGQSLDFKLFLTDTEEPGKKTKAIGPTVFRITGIVESDSNTVFFSLDDVPEAREGPFQSAKIKAENASATASIREAILPLGFSVSSVSDTIEEANKVFRILQLILMIFGLVALVVSAIGMFNTMTISLLERTEEIGIMKSVGASRTAISLLFIVESLLMGFLGSVVGVAMGWLAGKIGNLLLNVVATRFGGEAVNLFSIPIWFTLLIVAFGSLVGLITGLFPARQASRIDPLDALRYK